jgi:hypothetical protein
VELRRHRDNHVIEVGIEVAALGDIKAKGRGVVVTCKEVVRVVDQTRLVSTCLGQLRRPYTHVGILGLVDSKIGWPHSVMNLSLTVVPFLEEITSILLVSWVNFG